MFLYIYIILIIVLVYALQINYLLQLFFTTAITLFNNNTFALANEE